MTAGDDVIEAVVCVEAPLDAHRPDALHLDVVAHAAGILRDGMIEIECDLLEGISVQGEEVDPRTKETALETDLLDVPLLLLSELVRTALDLAAPTVEMIVMVRIVDVLPCLVTRPFHRQSRLETHHVDPHLILLRFVATIAHVQSLLCLPAPCLNHLTVSRLETEARREPRRSNRLPYDLRLAAPPLFEHPRPVREITERSEANLVE